MKRSELEKDAAYILDKFKQLGKVRISGEILLG